MGPSKEKDEKPVKVPIAPADSPYRYNNTGGTTPRRPGAASREADDQDVVSAKKGGMTASARADGIAQRGKTRGKMV
jgi:hypothetical protein